MNNNPEVAIVHERLTEIAGGDDAATVAAFTEQVARFDRSIFDPAAIRQHAERFSRAEFRRKMAHIVNGTVNGTVRGDAE
ncbi:MAG: hypothetical protein WCK21_11075 [Actinomycetota bacterium]